VLWLLPEPRRGETDIAITPSLERSTVLRLFRNRGFLAGSLAMAMYTFAVGGLQVWMPTFLHRVRGMSVADAGILFGLIAAINGTVATLLGGWIGDRMLVRQYGAYYRFCGIAIFVAVPLMMASVYLSGSLMRPSIFFAVFALLIGTGVANAGLVNSVDAGVRSTAVAFNIFITHALGDALSPAFIGWISDRTSLQTSFSAAFIAAALSGWLFLYGARFSPNLRAALKAAHS
jgi:sugar phosphate permease